jgi:hypothetical protein
LNNSKDKRKRPMLQWATPVVALGLASESGLAHLGLSAQDEIGSPLPIPHRRAARRPNLADQRQVAGEGGAWELALEVRILIWGIDSGGAHHGRLVVAKHVGGAESAMTGWRRGGGHRLGVHRAAVSTGGGHCGDGGAHRWPEVVLDGKAALANEGGGRVGALMVPCGGQWLSGQLEVAHRRTRAVRGGQCSALGAEADGERQTGVGERSVAIAGRGENGLLLQTNSERRRRTGRWLHALLVEVGRQVACVGAAAGTVRM